MNLFSFFKKEKNDTVEFHDSQNVPETELKKCSKKAELQSLEIKKIISGMHDFTACEVLMQMKYPKPPITSIRRTLSNMKKRDELYRTGERRESFYGGKEFVHMKSEFWGNVTAYNELSLNEWAREFKPEILKEYNKFIADVRYKNSNLF